MATNVANKTNERPGVRAVLRYCRMSSFKAREVLDLVRGVEYSRAVEILDHTERAAARVVAKLVRSAAANAEHNEGLDPEELYVATAYADEGATLKRWRPRARGRATRINKRSCHITVVLAPMPEEQLLRRRARIAAEAAERRARRVAATRRRGREVAESPAGAASAEDLFVDEALPEESVLAAVGTEETLPEELAVGELEAEEAEAAWQPEAEQAETGAEDGATTPGDKDEEGEV